MLSVFCSWGEAGMKNVLGEMLYILREKEGVAQKDLAEGLLSISELSRVEKGERDEDKFVLAALFERLGKSLDKFEFLYTLEEYQMSFLRGLIEKNMGDGKFEVAMQLLKEYEVCNSGDENIHKQYYGMMCAVLYYLAGHDAEEGLDYLDKALSITHPDWKRESWESLYFCEQEIRMILFISCIYLENGKMSAAGELLERIAGYMEEHITDTEEKGKLYPQCAWLLAEIYCEEEECEKAIAICRSGKSSLIKNGSLMIIDRLLKIEKICLKKTGRLEEARRLEYQEEAVDFAYELAEYSLPEGKMLRLLLLGGKEEVTVCSEALCEIRKAYALSQEELSEDICSRETLSRIESGKRSPNKRKFAALLKKMGEGHMSCYSYVEADDYRIYEKVVQYKKYWYIGKKEKSSELLNELETELDMSKDVNRQFIEGNRIIGKVYSGEMGYEEGFTEMKRILRYTMKKFEETVYRVPYREEAVILNCMALYLEHMGRVEEAIQLYEQMLNKYKDSAVLERHHSVPLSLIYTNYTGYLEVNNELDKAERIGQEGIKLMLECQRGDSIAEIIGNLSCVYEKKKDQRRCKLYLEQCYWLLALYDLKNDMHIVQKQYEDVYGEKIG